eukprot:XP_764154.1 hypothetical protein [Theileria parva strain Muguga]
MSRRITYSTNYTPNLGFCTNKWLQDSVAIKCYDCEYDSTCAVCLECFFNSDHTSHEYRLTRTSGGCCGMFLNIKYFIDCGDASSWNFKGSCKNHTHFVDNDERTTLACFTNSFLVKLESLLTQIIYYITEYLKNIHIIDEYSLQILILFLNDLVKVSSSYRFALNLCLSKEVLKDWILKHQILSNDIQKSFNSLYLTLLTSMAFKMKFATLFASLYIDIVQPLKEIPDEWHLSNLSVQLFTYSSIAHELFKNSFLNYCIEPIMDKNLLDKRLNKIQFTRFDRKKFSLYIRILSDITYLFNHNSVCDIVLSDTNIQRTILSLLATHNQMNLIEREEYEHVSYENSGYSIAFTIEHTIHSALKPLADYCKNLPEERTDQILKFYLVMNDFIASHLLNEKKHTDKLTRSFHIPFVRFFTYLVDFNFVRRCLRSHLNRFEKKDEFLSEYLDMHFPDLTADVTGDCGLLNMFDNDVLIYILKSAIDVLKFSMEIKQNLWVYNGESMHEQRTNYYELLFDSYDISAIHICVCLLAMKNIGTDFDLLSKVFNICLGINENLYGNNPMNEGDSDEELGKGDRKFLEKGVTEVDTSRSTIIPEDLADGDISESTRSEEDESTTSDEPGDMQFKLSFFFMIMNTLINDIKHTEILSVPKKTMKEGFVKRGLPLLKMDVVYALVSGNAEFGKVVNETKKHWKHHPMLIETIENLASLNYSKVSDKTYVRLKPESYKMIDILWNPQYPITHSVCKNSLKENISLLGSCSEVMSREYNETQNFILNSISCTSLFHYIFAFISNICKIDFNLKDQPFYSLPDLYTKHYTHLNEHGIKIITSNDMKEYSECILYSLKILNLFLTKLPLPTVEVGKMMVNSLELVLKNMDDEIYKKCLSYTILNLKRIYMIDNSISDLLSDGIRKDVKLIQRQMLQRLSSQNTMFSNEIDEDEELTTETNEDDLTCILCKQVMDSMSNMSYMTFVSTNNVLRRCCTSVQSGKNYNVYAMSSMPLKSSIMTTCGHIAHTKCINEHRKIQTDNHIFSMYGIQKSKNEFFCPVCKSLCNYTLNITTIDSVRKRRGLFSNDTLQVVDKTLSPHYQNFSTGYLSSIDRSEPETPEIQI